MKTKIEMKTPAADAKEAFEPTVVEVIVFSAEDVITTSPFDVPG